MPLVAGRLNLHGPYVCKARKPDCPQCAIRDLCQFKAKAGNAAAASSAAGAASFQ